MDILHGTWLAQRQRFALWGEDTTATPAGRRGRRGKVAPYPGLMDVSQLLRHLDRYSPDSQPDGGEVIAWLPGVGKQPIPSPEAQSTGMTASEGERLLLGWSIGECIMLAPADALDYLLGLPPRDDPQHGFVVGSDLRFWQQAGLLAMNCLVEQRYIPALEQRGSVLTAHWQPQPAPDVLDQLAAAMPPLCRAFVEDPHQPPQPHELLGDFLQNAVDGFVREAYQAKRAPSHLWLKALIGSNRQVRGAAAKNKRLFEAWQQWQGVSLEDELGNLRVCFKLEEPAGEDANMVPGLPAAGHR